ncbi:hypothetical protein ACH5RR_015208 [Cinchona calisaya]|uniref:Uncharacterized protein n=1 Tax=Cinchona calisaya TaxID=153742 RepID=A0ABD2ZSJ3_9GENT
MEVVRKSLTEWNEFNEVRNQAQRESRIETSIPVPNVDQSTCKKSYIIITTDAAINLQKKQVGMGIEARTDNGPLLKTWAETEQKIGEAVVEEA